MQGPNKKNKRVRHSASTAAESWRKFAHFDNALSKECPSVLLKMFPELPHVSMFSLFCKLLMPEYLTSLAEMMRRYAHGKGMLLNVTLADLWQLLGLTLLTCYHSLPSDNTHWSTAKDLAVVIVAAAMHRK